MQKKPLNESTEKILALYHAHQDVLRFCPVRFLSRHAGLDGEILWREQTRPKVTCLTAGLVNILYTVLTGAVKMCRSAFVAQRASILSESPVVLVPVSGGQKKHTREIREICDVFARKSYTVKMVNLNSLSVDLEPYDRPTSNEGIAGIFSSILSSFPDLFYLWKNCLSEDPIRRTIAARSGRYVLWQHIQFRKAKTLLKALPASSFIFSVLPFNANCRLLVEAAKIYGIPSFSIRTQTTTSQPELALLNSQYIFYKSAHEKTAYKKTIRDKKIKLLEGCILSLSEDSGEVSLPENYALVLGTAQTADQTDDDYLSVLEQALRIAADIGLTVVFKGHNLSDKLDSSFLAELDENLGHEVIRFRGNVLSLIRGASVVLSFYSTLLYDCILESKPIIILSSAGREELGEFEASPIIRAKIGRKRGRSKTLAYRARKNVVRVSEWFRRCYSYDDDSIESICEKSIRIASAIDREGG